MNILGNPVSKRCNLLFLSKNAYICILVMQNTCNYTQMGKNELLMLQFTPGEAQKKSDD